jgi:hypothetical protein
VASPVEVRTPARCGCYCHPSRQRIRSKLAGDAFALDRANNAGHDRIFPLASNRAILKISFTSVNLPARSETLLTEPIRQLYQKDIRRLTSEYRTCVAPKLELAQ